MIKETINSACFIDGKLPNMVNVNLKDKDE
jgi:hypothetical protein